MATAGALVAVLANPISPADPARTTLVRLAWIYAATALAFFFAGSRDRARRGALCPGRGAAVPVRPRGRGGRLPAPDPRDRRPRRGGHGAGGERAGRPRRPCCSPPGPAARAPTASPRASSRRGSPFSWPPTCSTPRLDVRRAKGLEEAGNVIFSKWNSFSRVTVWGNLANETALIMIDADAATEVTRQGPDLPRHAYLAERVEALGWHLRPNAKALILGPGGGNDVIAALLFGAREVTAVEVNPIIARDLMSSEPLRIVLRPHLRAAGRAAGRGRGAQLHPRLRPEVRPHPGHHGRHLGRHRRRRVRADREPPVHGGGLPRLPGAPDAGRGAEPDTLVPRAAGPAPAADLAGAGHPRRARPRPRRRAARDREGPVRRGLAPRARHLPAQAPPVHARRRSTASRRWPHGTGSACCTRRGRVPPPSSPGWPRRPIPARSSRRCRATSRPRGTTARSSSTPRACATSGSCWPPARSGGRTTSARSCWPACSA